MIRTQIMYQKNYLKILMILQFLENHLQNEDKIKMRKMILSLIKAKNQIWIIFTT